MILAVINPFQSIEIISLAVAGILGAV